MISAAGRKSRFIVTPPCFLAILLLLIFAMHHPFHPCSTPRAGGPQQHQVNTQGNLLPQKLIDAMIQVESSGDPRAVSKCGAIGLMQVRPVIWLKTLKKAGIIKSRADLFDPDINIRAGKFILAHYLKRHNGDLRKALHSYSGGAKGYYRKVMEAHNGQKTAQR